MVTLLNGLSKNRKFTKDIEEFVTNRIDIMEDLEQDYNEYYKGIPQLIQRARSMSADTREYRSAQQLNNYWVRVTTAKARGF